MSIIINTAIIKYILFQQFFDEFRSSIHFGLCQPACRLRRNVFLFLFRFSDGDPEPRHLSVDRSAGPTRQLGQAVYPRRGPETCRTTLLSYTLTHYLFSFLNGCCTAGKKRCKKCTEVQYCLLLLGDPQGSVFTTFCFVSFAWESECSCLLR